MYSPESFNPFWVGQPDSSFGRSRNQYTRDYNSFGDSGANGYNRNDVGGHSVVRREYTTYGENLNGDYGISDGNHDYAFNKVYGVARSAGGSDGSLEGGFDSRLGGGSVAAMQQGRATKPRGSYFSFGYDNSSSPISYMR